MARPSLFHCGTTFTATKSFDRTANGQFYVCLYVCFIFFLTFRFVLASALFVRSFVVVFLLSSSWLVLFVYLFVYWMYVLSMLNRWLVLFVRCVWFVVLFVFVCVLFGLS